MRALDWTCLSVQAPSTIPISSLSREEHPRVSLCHPTVCTLPRRCTPWLGHMLQPVEPSWKGEEPRVAGARSHHPSPPSPGHLPKQLQRWGHRWISEYGTMTREYPDDKPLSCMAVATPCGMRAGRRGCGSALPCCYPGDCTKMLGWAAGSCLQPLCLHMSRAAPLLLTAVSWVMPSPGRQNLWAWNELWCLGSYPSKIPARLDAGLPTAANALGTKAAPVCRER